MPSQTKGLQAEHDVRLLCNMGRWVCPSFLLRNGGRVALRTRCRLILPGRRPRPLLYSLAAAVCIARVRRRLPKNRHRLDGGRGRLFCDVPLRLSRPLRPRRRCPARRKRSHAHVCRATSRRLGGGRHRQDGPRQHQPGPRARHQHMALRHLRRCSWLCKRPVARLVSHGRPKQRCPERRACRRANGRRHAAPPRLGNVRAKLPHENALHVGAPDNGGGLYCPAIFRPHVSACLRGVFVGGV